ncbi:hypothetical protein GCM10010124_31320 [Pilimelia terevasa]|uniref:Transcriptional regulator n=1 Tax=Pilimelia terevasa TaxID=53372 RepID=A0A8J3FK37_9ACTN|nr:helix-turn-helix transcriptional regulator [Pilimelia terevasa]GGK36413.1 hypothetical protein GCM10010124_31320 [Pilimelia terevasa]
MTADGMPDALREARRSSGIAFHRFASLAGYSEGHLRSVENGRRAVTEDIATAYDRVLRTGGMFVVQLRTLGGIDAVSWGRASTEALLTTITQETDDVKRRSILALPCGAMAATATLWADALSPATPVEGHGPQRIDVRLVDHIDQRLDHLRHLDDQIGSGELTRLARSELTLIARLLRNGRFTEPVGRRLYSLAAEASRQAAWGHFDQDHNVSAQRYFDLALRASADAGDPAAGAYAMSFMAVQCYSTGHPRDAIALLEAAQAAISRTGTARMKAMLAARHARALSKTGDKQAYARMLHKARVELERGPSEDDPPTLYWVSEAEIEMIAGSSALDLGDAREAIRRFDAAIAADTVKGEYARSQAIYFARAAKAHIQVGDLDGALSRAEDARQCLSSVDSARSSATLAQLRGLLRSHAKSRAVRTFLQQDA